MSRLTGYFTKGARRYSLATIELQKGLQHITFLDLDVQNNFLPQCTFLAKAQQFMAFTCPWYRQSNAQYAQRKIKLPFIISFLQAKYPRYNINPDTGLSKLNNLALQSMLSIRVQIYTTYITVI